MGREFFIIYLVYGLVFIAMGIYASGKKDRDVSHIPLVKSLKYLGVFGVAHGLSEWITMFVITELYHEHYVYMFYIKQLLKAVSFAFLMLFGISLLIHKWKSWSFMKAVPVLLLSIWSMGLVFYIYQHGLEYHLGNPQYNSVMLRYFMGFPAGMVAAWALYSQAMMLKKEQLYDIQKKYKRLAMIFLVYGIIDGLFVRPMDFFPANLINNSLFIDWFGFPIQIIKIAVGIGINYLLIQVINTFGWEQKERLKQLEKQRIAYEERKKLGLEVHDSIIQNMYASSLKIQYLINGSKTYPAITEELQEILKDVKTDLGDAIKKTRSFISETTIEQIELKELKSRLQLLIETFDRNPGIQASLTLQTDSLTAGKMSTKDSSHLFYIVREAVNNAIKHSGGTVVHVKLETKIDKLYITVVDNGSGINVDSDIVTTSHFGIKSMIDRAEQIDGELAIRNGNPGTEVELIIPWEMKG